MSEGRWEGRVLWSFAWDKVSQRKPGVIIRFLLVIYNSFFRCKKTPKRHDHSTKKIRHFGCYTVVDDIFLGTILHVEYFWRFFTFLKHKNEIYAKRHLRLHATGEMRRFCCCFGSVALLKNLHSLSDPKTGTKGRLLLQSQSFHWDFQIATHEKSKDHPRPLPQETYRFFARVSTLFTVNEPFRLLHAYRSYESSCTYSVRAPTARARKFEHYWVVVTRRFIFSTPHNSRSGSTPYCRFSTCGSRY